MAVLPDFPDALAAQYRKASTPELKTATAELLAAYYMSQERHALAAHWITIANAYRPKDDTQWTRS